MAYNPSNKEGLVQSGSRVYGVVVDRNDPEKRGRFKVRIMGDQDDLALQPDEQLQWIQTKTPNQPQLRGNGSFPAQYMVGSKVELQNYGQQGYIISGAYPNNEQDSEYQDFHTEATPTSRHKVADIMSDDQNPLWTRKDQNWGIVEISPDGNSGTIIGRRYQNKEQPTPTSPYKEDQKKGIINERRNAYGDPESKAPTDKPLGRDRYPSASPDKVDEEMKGLGVKELIPKALDMINNLRNTIKSGSNPKMPDSVGGMGNIMSALSGIASMFADAQNTQKQAQKKKNILESELRRLYKAFTGLEPLDLFGNETPQYQAWRTNYLTSTGYTEENDVIKTANVPYTGS